MLASGWEGRPAHPAFADKKARHTRSGKFALHVIDSANALATRDLDVTDA